MQIAALLFAVFSAVAPALTGASNDVESTLTSRIVTPVYGFPCFRLMTTNGDAGCSTGSDGSTGYLYRVDDSTDLQAFASLGNDSPRRAVIMPADLLTTGNMQRLGSLSYFAGALVKSQLNDPTSGFSPASQELPVGAPVQFNWNPNGRGLLSERFEFPIVALSAADTATFAAQAQLNKEGGYDAYPQYAVHFFFNMGPSSLTSTSCFGQQSCLPLGGQSVWATMGSLNASTRRLEELDGYSERCDPYQIVSDASHKAEGPLSRKLNLQSDSGHSVPRRLDTALPQRYVVAIAQMDANSLFHDVAFGADAAVSGLVALLAAAQALSTNNIAAQPLRVLFAAFQGEEFGRIGSRRWLSEVTSFECLKVVPASNSPTGMEFCANPLRSNTAFESLDASQFDFVVAADQVGAFGLNTLFSHEYDRHTPQTNFTSQILAALTGLPLPVLPADVAVPPPGPLVSFLEASGFQGDATVLSGYSSQFTSKVYQSHFDTTIDAAAVTSSATVLARVLFALATGIQDPADAAAQVPADLSANATLVSELVDCITVNAQCPLFAQILGLSAASLAALVPANPLSLYVSVYNQPYSVGDNGYVLQPTPLEAFVRNWLAFYGATNRGGGCAATTDCTPPYECIMGQCLVSTAFYHDALSPAILVQGYGQFAINSSLVTAADPVWTEPFWSNYVGTKRFLMDSHASDAAVFGVGIFVTALSIPAMWFLIRFLDKHYKVP